MNYVLTEITYPSRNGVDTIHGYIYSPASGEIKGIVQLAHGMIDYVGRYGLLIDFLTKNGYVFAGNDHIGHGKSASAPEKLGFYPGKNGASDMVRDLHTMNKILKERFPGLPLVMLGHSMGSFLSRLYIEKYPHTADGHIIHGTSGPMNASVVAGKLLARLVELTKGADHRSKLLNSVAFSSYNAKFPKSEGKHAWLTREVERVNCRDEDPFTNYTFTCSGYIQLFTALGECSGAKWFKSYPKSMNTLILGGTMDPVGQYGRGCEKVYKKLLLEGASAVSIKLYEGARHELFNESCREEVFADILAWLTETAK